MFYDKKIKYLNYIVNGERIKGCGFLKVEVRDCVIHLEVVVSGLPPSLHAYTDVWVCTETATYSLGNIYLDNGGGSFRVSDSNLVEISPMGVAYSEWKGIAIFPKEGSEISAYWEEQPKCVLERVEVSKELVGEMRATPVSEQTAGEGCVSTESVPPETVEQEKQETKEVIDKYIKRKKCRAGKNDACTHGGGKVGTDIGNISSYQTISG